MKSVLVLWLVGFGIVVSHVGCCSIQMDGACGTGACGMGPGLFAGMGSCNTGSCGEATCDSGCGLPFSNIRRRLVNRVRTNNCSSGCGEVYWDEQINEPPVRDPCGCDGQFTGTSCGSGTNALSRLRQLWGFRYQPAGWDSCSTCDSGGAAGSCSGCSSCDGGNQLDSNGSHSNYGVSNSNMVSSESMGGNSVMPRAATPSHAQPSSVNPSMRNSEPMQTTAPKPVPVRRSEPTPALRPTPRTILQSTDQEPTLMDATDSTTMHRSLRSSKAITIGSGVERDPNTFKTVAKTLGSDRKPVTVKAKPVSAISPPRNRLVTNPR